MSPISSLTFLPLKYIYNITHVLFTIMLLHD